MAKFKREHMDFLQKRGIITDSQAIQTDEDFIEIEDKVADILQMEGFDDEYEVTAIGKLCEEILDRL